MQEMGDKVDHTDPVFCLLAETGRCIMLLIVKKNSTDIRFRFFYLISIVASHQGIIALILDLCSLY